MVTTTGEVVPVVLGAWALASLIAVLFCIRHP